MAFQDMLHSIIAGCERLLTPNLRAFEDSLLWLLNLVALEQVNASAIWLVRPNVVHAFSMHLQINKRFTRKQTIQDIALDLVLSLHVQLQVIRVRESFCAANKKAFDDTWRVRLVLVQVLFVTIFVYI
jgi:hypothetical protein